MNTHHFCRDDDYWARKTAYFLDAWRDHPILGAFASEARDCFGLSRSIDLGIAKEAAVIAEGRSPLEASPDRGTSASSAPNKIVFTHPTGAEPPLVVRLQQAVDPKQTASTIAGIVRRDCAGLSAEGKLNYLVHVLRNALERENAAGLGGCWHRLPADMAMPDHSVWERGALVSALASCIELSGQARSASLVVFSITPVQDFIVRARKLRDYWTGSLILSWLSFEGIQSVMRDLGPDHILYPSLLGQPLVERALTLGFERPWFPDFEERMNDGVATFPNKFVFLSPKGQEEVIAARIRGAVETAWAGLSDGVLQTIHHLLGEDAYVAEVFQRQLSSYWDFHWSACPLQAVSGMSGFQALLHEDVWKKPVAYCDATLSVADPARDDVSRGILYGVTHSLIQSRLAAGKTYRTNRRPDEPGIKCRLHSDLEILHFGWKNGDDRNPRGKDDPFWRRFKEKWPAKPDFKSAERLSSLGAVKRIAYNAVEKDHPLRLFFKAADMFPSTTEIALSDWFYYHRSALTEFAGREGWPLAKLKRKIAQLIHWEDAEDDKEFPEIEELDQSDASRLLDLMRRLRKKRTIQAEDKYFAVLAMDGDSMGKLINGETVAATWRSVLNPEARFAESASAVNPDQTRLISPAVHAAISESLGDFSLFTVPRVIKRCGGRLIYAGGDDVCAVAPVSRAIEAARRLAGAYSWGFAELPADENDLPKALQGECDAPPTRLAVHLGSGERISISAAILIAHHKRPLSGVMTQAAELLKNGAKKQAGRNALAVRVDRRSGGARDFVCRWDEKAPPQLFFHEADNAGLVLDQFLRTAQALGTERGRSLSRSLMYRLAQMKDGIEAIIEHHPEQLHRFVAALIEKTGLAKHEEAERLSADVSTLLARRSHNGLALDTDGLLVAAFVGKRIVPEPDKGGDTP
jgi:CRISPR-associated protein Cmr2